MVEVKRIVKRNIEYMRVDGNIHIDEYKETAKYYLEYNGIAISNVYYAIIPLPNDHYAALDVVQTGPNIQLPNLNKCYPGLEYKNKIIKVYPKYASEDEIIEKEVTPAVYDDIRFNSENTAIGFANGKSTIIDIDVKSPYYGMQLVPAIFDEILPFGIPYDGFAACMIDGEKKFLPRYIKPKCTLDSSDLLSEEEVLEIINNQREESKSYTYMPKKSN